MGTAMYKHSTYGNFAKKGITDEDRLYGLECTENILKNLNKIKNEKKINEEHIRALEELAAYYKSQL